MGKCEVIENASSQQGVLCKLGWTEEQSAICKSKLWFGHDNHLSTLVLNFNKIISISSGCGQTEANTQPA
jgi:hypothetical protein